MLVSVITVCYNSENTIRRTIESVLNQTYNKIEYIIIDGGSSDQTVCIAKEYQKKFEERGYQYKIVSEKDNGIYDAMNKGIRMSKGRLTGIINSDDWYELNAVEYAVKVYRRYNYDMFYADIRLIKKDGSIMIKHSRLDKFPTSRHWNHPSTFVTKRLYDELGTFRCKGLYDDFDMLLRTRRAGKKIVVKNIILANFRVGGVSNEKSIKKCWKRCKDRYACYRDNGYGRYYIIECICIELAKMIIG